MCPFLHAQLRFDKALDAVFTKKGVCKQTLTCGFKEGNYSMVTRLKQPLFSKKPHTKSDHRLTNTMNEGEQDVNVWPSKRRLGCFCYLITLIFDHTF